MPVANATIKAQVSALIEQTKILEQQQSADAYAQGLANIIQDAISSATVTIPPSAIVTVGSPSSQTNVAPVIGTLS